MQAAVLDAPRQLRIAEVPDPVPGRGDLLVRVEACGICPSDLRMWRTGRSDLLPLPAVIGHEAAGTIIEAGPDADPALVGRRVFVDGYGGFAEYSLITATAIARQGGPFLLPDGVPWDCAVFAEPLADCLFAVEHCADSGSAATAMVAGCGQMGLQVGRLLVLRGLAVLAVDPIPERRQLASAFGSVAVTEAAVPEAAAQLSGGRGLDLAIVACPDPAAVSTALAALGPGGVCVLFSALPAGTVPVDLDDIHRRRLRIVGSRWIVSRGAPRWELYRQAVRLIADRSVDVGPLVDSVVSFDGLLGAFHAMDGRQVLKSVLHPDGDLGSR
jgi:L-iditol 2-dehydrogenase